MADRMTLQQLVEQATAALEYLAPETEVEIRHSYRQEPDALSEASMRVGLSPEARELKDGTFVLTAQRLS